MNTTEIQLKEIIDSNIEWFWKNDPLVVYETDTAKLWKGFQVWCTQNCKECFEDIDEEILKTEIQNCYSSWEAYKNNKYVIK